MPIFAQLVATLFGSAFTWIMARTATRLAFFGIAIAAILAFAHEVSVTLIPLAASVLVDMPTYVTAPVSWIIPPNFAGCAMAYLTSRVVLFAWHWFVMVYRDGAKVAGGA